MDLLCVVTRILRFSNIGERRLLLFNFASAVSDTQAPESRTRKKNLVFVGCADPDGASELTCSALTRSQFIHSQTKPGYCIDCSSVASNPHLRYPETESHLKSHSNPNTLTPFTSIKELGKG